MSKKATESFANALENLAAARDEARLELHLLSMEARERWNELESKIVTLLEEKADQVSEASAANAQELARSIRQFVETHVRGKSDGHSPVHH